MAEFSHGTHTRPVWQRSNTQISCWESRYIRMILQFTTIWFRLETLSIRRFSGLHQFARYGLRVEIRVVLHAVTIPRLPELADYIYRNFTFAEHIALMGLENIGYAPRNMDTLWIDPGTIIRINWSRRLNSVTRGMNVSIYNHQLCVLRKSLWKFARKSISDWKNIYLEECAECGVRNECGGFFQWATKLHSAHIRPVPSASRNAIHRVETPGIQPT